MKNDDIFDGNIVGKCSGILMENESRSGGNHPSVIIEIMSSFSRFTYAFYGQDEQIFRKFSMEI